MPVKTFFAFLFLTTGTRDRPLILTRSILMRSSFSFITYHQTSTVQTQTQQPTSNFTTQKKTIATSKLYPITNPHNNNHFYIKFVPKPTVPTSNFCNPLNISYTPYPYINQIKMGKFQS